MQFKLWASELLLRLQYYEFKQCHSVISMHKLVFGDNPGNTKQHEGVL